METIIVITVLCVILITLYASYSSLLISVKSKSLYDNTEYIYKTAIIRNYLEENNYIESWDLNAPAYCSNSLNKLDTTIKSCKEVLNEDEFQQSLFETLNVEAVYITWWDTNKILQKDLVANFEPTTQNYIKSLDPTDEYENGRRIIVMFKSENDTEDQTVYQYASLRVR